LTSQHTSLGELDWRSLLFFLFRLLGLLSKSLVMVPVDFLPPGIHHGLLRGPSFFMSSPPSVFRKADHPSYVATALAFLDTCYFGFQQQFPWPRSRYLTGGFRTRFPLAAIVPPNTHFHADNWFSGIWIFPIFRLRACRLSVGHHQSLAGRFIILVVFFPVAANVQTP